MAQEYSVRKWTLFLIINPLQELLLLVVVLSVQRTYLRCLSKQSIVLKDKTRFGIKPNKVLIKPVRTAINDDLDLCARYSVYFDIIQGLIMCQTLGASTFRLFTKYVAQKLYITRESRTNHRASIKLETRYKIAHKEVFCYG